MEEVSIIRDILEGYIKGIAEVLPSFFRALVILLIGWIVAKLISKAVEKLLKRIKLNELLVKLNLNELLGEGDKSSNIASIIGKFIYYFIFLIFLSMAIELLGMQIITDQMTALIEFFPQVIVSVIIFLIGFYIATIIRNAINTATRSVGMAAGSIIANAIFYFLLVMVAVTAIEQLGVDTLLITSNISILIGGIIIAGALAYGLAAIDTMSNILSVFFAKKTFAVGQYIRIGEIEGQIIEISSVNFTIAQKGKKVIIPAKNFTKESVIISIDSVKELDEGKNS